MGQAEGNIIYESKRAKVYEREDGTYAIHLLRTHSFDGCIDQSWDVEVLEKDGMYAGGGVCTHNFPVRYPNDGKTLKERALAMAQRTA